MVKNELARKSTETQGCAGNEHSVKAPQGGTYQAPELHELGSLEQIQRYGLNFRDGTRYKDYPC